MQVEVAKDLAYGRALEEPVTGETCCVKKALDPGRFSDECIAVGSDLVQARPAVRDADVEQARTPALHGLDEVWHPILAVVMREAG